MSFSPIEISDLSAIIPTFSGGTMDRADQVRVNPEKLRAAFMKPNAKLLQLDGLNPVFDMNGSLSWGAVIDASPDNDLLLLGIDGDVPHFAELTGAGDAGPAANPALWQMLGNLRPSEAAIYATARSLARAEQIQSIDRLEAHATAKRSRTGVGWTGPGIDDYSPEQIGIYGYP